MAEKPLGICMKIGLMIICKANCYRCYCCYMKLCKSNRNCNDVLNRKTLSKCWWCIPICDYFKWIDAMRKHAHVWLLLKSLFFFSIAFVSTNRFDLPLFHSNYSSYRVHRVHSPNRLSSNTHRMSVAWVWSSCIPFRAFGHIRFADPRLCRMNISLHIFSSQKWSQAKSR